MHCCILSSLNKSGIIELDSFYLTYLFIQLQISFHISTELQMLFNENGFAFLWEQTLVEVELERKNTIESELIKRLKQSDINGKQSEIPTLFLGSLSHQTLC